MDQHADVSAALSQPMDGHDTDITELEEELEAILKEEEETPKNEIVSPEPVPTKTPQQQDEEEAIELLKSLDLDGKTIYLTAILFSLTRLDYPCYSTSMVLFYKKNLKRPFPIGLEEFSKAMTSSQSPSV